MGFRCRLTPGPAKSLNKDFSTRCVISLNKTVIYLHSSLCSETIVATHTHTRRTVHTFGPGALLSLYHIQLLYWILLYYWMKAYYCHFSFTGGKWPMVKKKKKVPFPLISFHRICSSFPLRNGKIRPINNLDRCSVRVEPGWTQAAYSDQLFTSSARVKEGAIYDAVDLPWVVPCSEHFGAPHFRNIKSVEDFWQIGILLVINMHFHTFQTQ